MNGFTAECNEVLTKSAEYAKKCGGLMGTEHVLCGMIECKESRAGKILATFGLNENIIPQILL